MGSNLNFKNFEQMQMDGDGSGGFSFPLARQSSVYSLTFDEFQSAVGATGKDFGSMNMDELLKNIWSAEENQNIGSTSGLHASGQEMGGSLGRQGSLILPRTLSLKTVEEVWKDMSKEYIGGTDLSGGSTGGFSMSQRQPTLGQMTLEEFLTRAGAVREETGSRLDGNANIIVSLNDLTPPLSSTLEFGFGYQQAANASGGLISGVVGIGESGIQMAAQPGNLPLSVNGVRSSAYEFGNQQQQLLPKQPAMAYTAPVAVQSNGHLSSPAIAGGFIGIADPSMNNTMVQNATLQGGGMGILGLGPNGVSIETGSPAVSTDGFNKVNGDGASVSPVPYVFNGGLRGRKVAAVEKIVERRHRRMIKNRESAARSRARKQAYTSELEAEVAKLKEENQELQKKQAVLVEVQKNPVLEMKNHFQRQCEWYLLRCRLPHRSRSQPCLPTYMKRKQTTIYRCRASMAAPRKSSLG